MASELTSLLADLIRIDSVNPALDPAHAGEGELARFVAAWAEGRGLHVRWLEATPGRPSVIVTAHGAGGGRNLLLNAHLDTVGVEGMAQPFTPVEKEGRLYGRGAMDMKASLAACLLALSDAQGAGLAGDLILTAVADEEHDSLGTTEAMAHLRAEGAKVAAAVVTEPTNLDVHVAHRGFSVLEVEFAGRASHTSQPAAGVNALIHMGRLLHALEGAARRLEEPPPHPLLGHGSLQPVLARGGKELFTTPASATLTLERRTVPGETAEQAEAEIRNLLEELEDADPTVNGVVRTLVARGPFEASGDSVVAKSLAAAITAERGAPPALTGAPYWTDATLVAADGIPTALCGPVGGGIHQAGEWVDLASAETLRRVLGRVAADICGA